MLCPATLVTRGRQHITLLAEGHGPQRSGMRGDSSRVIGGQFDKSSGSGEPGVPLPHANQAVEVVSSLSARGNAKPHYT